MHDMPPRVNVLAGPARSGKTFRLLAGYRRALADGQPGRALWLSPTYSSAAEMCQQLLDRTLPGCLSPNLLTFHQFGGRILAAAAPAMRPISAALARSILRRLISDCARRRELKHFAPICDTPGFLDLVAAFIRELKRLEIWPEELAAAAGHASDRDRELCRLYDAYQQLLARHDLYDAEGQFWAARALLREGRFGPFAAVRHVFVDGFSDFTRTEHEVLELLASRSEALWISLPLESESGRGDLFTKTTRTLDELRRRHADLALEQLPPRESGWPAMDHLERHLFADAQAPQPAADTQGIEILAAAGATHEIELVARRVKGLLVGADAADGKPVPPADILVVFRSLGETAALVREVFGQFGIPFAILASPSLDATPLTSALVAWLRLDVEGWPFRRVLEVLGHNYFRPAWPQWHHGRAAVALARLVRELEIPAGRAELVAGVERLAARAAAEVGEKRRLSRRLLDAQSAAPLLAQICRVLDALPERASPGEWAAALADLADELGLRRAAADSPLGAEAIERDHSAWERLWGALAESERLARLTGEAPPRWSRREFLDAIEDLLRAVELPLARDDAGRVRVLAAETARNLAAPYVFVAGLAEKAFPAPSRDDCLVSAAERRRLAAAGLPLASHALDSRFEMLLFYEVVTRATRRLVLSYPALDSAAQPLTPSPYLSEVQRACGPGRVLSNSQPQLTSVPTSDEVRSVREFRVRAAAEALAGRPRLLAELCTHSPSRQMAGNLLAALRMSEFRGPGDFGPFEGMLPSAAAAAKLAERFGAARCWSPSQLEQYAYCPFQFFMASVLSARPAEEPALGVDYMERGRLLHWVLAGAHRRLNELAGGPSSPGRHRREPFMDVVRSFTEQLLAARRDRALEGGLLEIDVRQIVEWIGEYYRQHAGYDQSWRGWSAPPRPAHFEVAFGPKRRDDDPEAADQVPDQRDPLSRPEAFELDCAGETIRFAGRIDRIDLGQIGGQWVFNVVDYKSGAGSKRTSLDWVRRGHALQLPLYALAAEWLLAERGAAPFRAAYWHISGKGYVEKEAVKFHAVAEGRLAIDPEWHALRASLPVRVRSLVEGVRRGEFPMHSIDPDCTGLCPFGTVCRVNQVRSLDKTWQPPGESTP
jgi:ATP-dependent helicase/DNAse subunit B